MRICFVGYCFSCFWTPTLLNQCPNQRKKEEKKKKKEETVLEGKQRIAGQVTWDIFSKNI
jgi:hypothetical protein